MAEKTTTSDAVSRGTPSFVCEVPLKVSRLQQRTLEVRLEAARQVYNACLGEAKRRVALIRQSKPYQQATMLPKDDPQRSKLFAQVRAAYRFSEYTLHAYAGQVRTSWLGQHLDSLTTQKIASQAFQAANRLLVGQAKRVRFKGKNQVSDPLLKGRGLAMRVARVIIV